MVALLIGAMVIPALTGTALIVSGRVSGPVSEFNANTVSLVTSVVTAALVIATVIARPVLNQPWLTSLGVRLHFEVCLLYTSDAADE